MENQDIEIKDKEKKPWKSRTRFLITILVIALIGFAAYKFSPLLLEREEMPEIKSGGEEFKSPEIGSFAPDFAWEDAYGNKEALSDFRGKKPVLLVFWATWCSLCDQELPYLKAFFEATKDDLEVFGIFSGEASWAVKDYIKKNEVSFPILLDSKRKVWKKYLVRGTPAHFLIDMDGKIIASIPGFASDYDLKMMFQVPVSY